MLQLLQENFPQLSDQGLQSEILANSKLVSFEADEVIMDVGQFFKTIPLVIKGSIKVMREDDDGNELFLYYINKGETCAMSLTCCMSNQKSTIRAVTEERTTLFMLPVHFMDQWMADYPSWRAFVMKIYRKRFEELMDTIDSIAFTRMDERLRKYILNKVKTTNTNTLKITHQEIAYELNSSREVISRLLKQLEKKGEIQLSRNKITLLRM